uniref:Uncharacterized protein n=1 Tax=Knipowitschia caucasica TaxID=637954 RepID=A0AAV2M0T6_KNICA
MSLICVIVKYDLNDTRKHAKLNRLNNAATVFVFFTVLINIFITALGFEGHSIRSQTPVAVLGVPDQFLTLPVPELNHTAGLWQRTTSGPSACNSLWAPGTNPSLWPQAAGK